MQPDIVRTIHLDKVRIISITFRLAETVAMTIRLLASKVKPIVPLVGSDLRDLADTVARYEHLVLSVMNFNQQRAHHRH
jgi:vacuolar-type H+-ATPase subunit F/Vma7